MGYAQELEDYKNGKGHDTPGRAEEREREENKEGSLLCWSVVSFLVGLFIGVVFS